MTRHISTSGLSRRRFVITAGAFGAAALVTGSAAAMRTAARPITWTGSALGAEASIQLFHHDPDWARQQLNRCQREIARLENLFSLYKPDSAICRLNAEGYLENPDIAFLELMSLATSFSQQTNGLFDVTVQPLWKLYAAHFSSEKADPAGPARKEIDAALNLVGSRYIRLAPGRIAFEKPGMAITLNGIAQGFITDRITVLLKSAGFSNVLVSLGENYALGRKADGTPWRVGILSPRDGKTIATTVELTNKALATSGGYGSPFSPRSAANHLLNPLTGEWAEGSRSITVVADAAVDADMASTALSLLSEESGRQLAARLPFVNEVIFG